MINNLYLKEFLKKTKWYEHFLVVVLFIVSIVLNFMDNKVDLFQKIILIFATIFNVLAVWNRFHKFKQDFVFSILANIVLLFSFVYVSNKENTLSYIIVLQYFLFSFFTLAGFVNIKKDNIVESESKFFSKDLFVALFVWFLSFFVFIIWLLKANAFHLFNILFIISVSFTVGGICTLYLFRWNYTFLFWQCSNIFCISYWIHVHLWTMVLLAVMYIFVDLLCIINWIKDSKNKNKKR